MSGSSKIIKNRIKSVKSVHNITKAMELVAVSKIKKVIGKLNSSRVYAKHSKELLISLLKEGGIKHSLISQIKNNKQLLIVVASNRGLCGSYNINVIKKTIDFIKNNKDKEIDIIAVGKKAEYIFKYTTGKAVASFVNFPDDLFPEDILPLSKMVINDFSQRKYENVFIAYTDFISSIKYETRVNSILPINKKSLEIMLNVENENNNKKIRPSVLFEPTEESVLNLVLPRLLEIIIYQTILESSASEHSARMMSMKNATDSAKSMINDLTLYYNQARQSGITQEIAEISGGTEALTNNQ